MSMEKLVSKLCKAGINVSYVRQVHDEVVVDIKDSFEDINKMFKLIQEGSRAGFDVNALKPKLLPAPKDLKGLPSGEISFTRFTNIEPVFIDYTKNTGSDMGDEKAKEIAEEMRKLYKETLGTFGVSADRVIDSINKLGYLETPWGGRRYLCRKSTMDDNDTLW